MILSSECQHSGLSYIHFNHCHVQFNLLKIEVLTKVHQELWDNTLDFVHQIAVVICVGNIKLYIFDDAVQIMLYDALDWYELIKTSCRINK